MGKIETFEVDRSFKEVAHTFQKKAPQSLNVRVKNHFSYDHQLPGHCDSI